MSEIKWLPCPFCGGNPKLISPRGRISWIQCCGFETETFDSKQKAIEFWNTRKPMERIVEQLEDLYQYNSQQAEIYHNVDNPDAYTRGQKEMYMDRAKCYGVAIRTVRNGGKE